MADLHDSLSVVSSSMVDNCRGSKSTSSPAKAQVYIWYIYYAKYPLGQFGHHLELSELSASVTPLDVDDEVRLEPLHVLIIDRILITEGPAHWVDTGGRDRTTALSELVPYVTISNG